jgi:ketosteroid isomerase-like protein
LNLKLGSIILLIALLLVLACGEKQVALENEKEAVKLTLIAMWEAVEKGDIETYAAYIHPEYTGFNEGDLLLVEGKEAEVEGTRSWLSSASEVKTRMHAESIRIEGPLAIMTYYWTDSGLDNGLPFEGQGKSTRVFKKVDGRWLCLHAHFTSVPRDSIQIETVFE